MRTFEIAQPGDPTVLGFTERDAPMAGTGQLVIRVAYAGLNFTDVLARRGAPGYASGWPFVPGMEVAGTVAAVGETVEGYEVGDTVVAFTPDGGGFAELVCADVRLSAHLPSGFDLATAAGMPLTWATALGLVRRANLEPGDKVLVTSASGGVGVALASVLAAAHPAVVVGGTGSVAKRDQLSERYVPVLRDHEFYARATVAAGGPFDVVLDSLGGDVLDEAANHLAVGARLISYGGAAGQSDPGAPAYPQLRAGNQTVSGFSILRLARTVPARAGVLVRGAVALAESSRVPAPHIVSWDRLVDAHVQQSEGHALGKTVVQIP